MLMLSPVSRSRNDTAMTASGFCPIRASIAARRESASPAAAVTAARANASVSTSVLSPDLVPYPVLVALAKEQRSDDERQQRNEYRIYEPRVDVARPCNQRRGDQWQEAAEPAVAEVVRQRHRRISNLRRKRLDEKRRNGTIHHRDEYHLDENEHCEHHRIQRVRKHFHRLVDRIVGDRGNEVSRHHDLLSAHPVGKRAEKDEERRADEQRDRDDDVGSRQR